jgi:hypothetical protein
MKINVQSRAILQILIYIKSMSRVKLIKAAFNKEANMVQDRGNQKF